MHHISQEPDELRILIDSTTDVEEKVILLKELDISLRDKNPAEAIQAAHQAVRLAKTTGDRMLVMRCTLQLGDSYRDHHKYDGALRYFKLAEKMLDVLPDNRPVRASLYRSFGLLYRWQEKYRTAIDYFYRSLEITRADCLDQPTAEALAFIGHTLFYIGNNARALEILTESMTISERIGDTNGCAMVFNSMGDICRALKDLRRAFDYYEKANRLVRDIGHRVGEAVTIGNMSTVCAERGDFERAMELSTRALEIFKELDMPLYIAGILHDHGVYHKDRGDYSTALQYLRESLSLYRNIEARSSIASNLNHIAEVSMAMENYGSIEEDLREAMAIAESIENQGIIAITCENYSEFYRHSDPNLALSYYKRSVEVHKQVQSHQAIETIAMIEARNEIKQAEIERELYRVRSAQLEAEMEHKKKELMSMALHLTKKNEFVAALRRQIDAFGKSASHCRIELVKEIIPKINENLNADGEWDTFERQFQQVHPDFIAMLSRRYPTLTPTELKVCALMKTNLTTKQIASLLCTSLRTVEGHRQYIRRKLGLSRADNLYTFLAALGLAG